MINSDGTWAFLGPNIIFMMNSRKEIRGVHRKNIGILIIPTCHQGEGEIILWKYSIKLYKCKFYSNKSMSLLGFWIRSHVDIDSPQNSPSLLWSLFLSSSPEVYCYAVWAASYSKWSGSQQPSNLYAHQLEASIQVTWSGLPNESVLSGDFP